MMLQLGFDSKGWRRRQRLPGALGLHVGWNTAVNMRPGRITHGIGYMYNML